MATTLTMTTRGCESTALLSFTRAVSGLFFLAMWIRSWYLLRCVRAACIFNLKRRRYPHIPTGTLYIAAQHLKEAVYDTSRPLVWNKLVRPQAAVNTPENNGAVPVSEKHSIALKLSEASATLSPQQKIEINMNTAVVGQHCCCDVEPGLPADSNGRTREPPPRSS